VATANTSAARTVLITVSLFCEIVGSERKPCHALEFNQMCCIPQEVRCRLSNVAATRKLGGHQRPIAGQFLCIHLLWLVVLWELRVQLLPILGRLACH